MVYVAVALSWAVFTLLGVFVWPAVIFGTRRRRHPLLWRWAVGITAGAMLVGLERILWGLRPEWRYMPILFAYPVLWSTILSAAFGTTRDAGKHVGLVWWKRRQRSRGKVLSGFWEDVADDYHWRTRKTHADSAAVELEAAEAPAGSGVEPEAAHPPVGRGTELQSGAAEERRREAHRHVP